MTHFGICDILGLNQYKRGIFMSNEKKTRVVVRLELHPEYNELVDKWMDGLRFNTKRECTETLLVLGAMTLEIMGDSAITSEAFASALYMVGGRVLESELRDGVRKTVEEFKRWREMQDMKADQTRLLTETLVKV